MHKQPILIALTCLILWPKPALADQGALKRYVDAPDKSYRWVERDKGTWPGIEYVELTLTSQTWRDIDWHHRLFIIRPVKGVVGKQALLLIAGGSWHDRDSKPITDKNRQTKPSGKVAMMAMLAARLQSPVAVLLNVPRQPMFENRHEDALISLTFDQYLKTGDDTWPLLLPMTKSAVRAMDAVQDFAAKRWNLPIDNFTVTGGSKRGWTTWLTAAVDPRVNAIAPMVIDMLNIAPQMKHQVMAWGGYSEKISDYTERNLQERLSEPQGAELRAIVDPYAYREKITQPKIILLGTNDRYWPVDALNLYWDGLKGSKYITYVPNQGHSLRDFTRVLGSIAAIHHQASGQLQLPKLTWQYTTKDHAPTLHITSTQKPAGLRAWRATSATRDFRDAKWTSKPITQQSKAGYEHRFTLPADRYAAVFAEARYLDHGLPYFLSTTIRIIEPK